jgi:RND family efflux transporter MFP subunit
MPTTCAATLALALWLPAVPALSDTTLSVVAVQAQADPDQRTFTIVGEVRARNSVSTGFPAGGRVVEVRFEEGDKVQAGAELARVESVQQAQGLRAAEADLQSARASWRQAEEDFRRLDALLSSGATTRAIRDAAEQDYQSSTGALAQAEAELDRARRALADTVLTAPASAIVIRRMVDPGQVVGTAQPVVELALDTGLEAVFEVPEVVLTAGAPAAGVTLSRISKPEESFPGRVHEVSPIVNAQTGTVTVTIQIDDPPAGLGFGEPVRGTASFDEGNRVAVPWSALTATAEGPAVWRIDPESSTADLRQVVIARHETGRVILASGVEPGDLVVIRGTQLLFPGRAVRMVEEPG